MPERIADTLVLTLTRGMSLAEWDRLGLLGREWALYAKLRDDYERFVVVSYGGADEEALARSLDPAPIVVCNREGLSETSYAAAMPGLVAQVCTGEVLIRTNQMEGGDAAIRIARELRARGHRTGLIARGGYLRSRFLAYSNGTDAPETLTAGAEEAELCRAADVIVGTSRAMVGDLAWRLGLSRERFVLIPNYVTTDRDPVMGAERRADEVLYAGQLVRRKRVDLLIEAMAELPEPMRATSRLSIVGEGPERDALEALARERGVKAVFEARIPHDELLTRMAHCAVYAQASELEGHPKAVLEAMAMGAAVVVADSPGLGSVIDHGLTGLKLPLLPEAFGRSFEMLLGDEELRTSLGLGAARVVRERYGLETLIELERSAHRRALDLAGDGATLPSAGVRFDPDLLNMPRASQVEAWERCLSGFSRRLAPRARAEFLLGVDEPLYRLQGLAAVAAEGGLHPKHRLTRYHDFFTARVRHGERVLDLGCGGGALACAIASTCHAHVVGMDLVESHLDAARARARGAGLSRLQFVAGDLTRDRVESTFDVIVLSNVLEHLRDRSVVLDRLNRWYRPRCFLIRVPAFERDWRVPYKRDLGLDWRLDNTHETEYLSEQVTVECAEGGLHVDEMKSNWGEFWLRATPRARGAGPGDA
jgi:glycosyltransferase involved in cell wall biosynthesis/SAM-dependent methyltransferase